MNDKKINKIKKECLIFCGIFTITLIIFHTYLSEHFSSDTFEIMHLGYKTYIKAYFFPGGRLFSCLLLYLADILKLSVNNLVLLSTIFLAFSSKPFGKAVPELKSHVFSDAWLPLFPV